MTPRDGRLSLWLAAPLGADVEQALARLLRAEDVARVAVMPDVHLAADVCVGTVVACTARIYPNAVGGDIGCGMAAARFSCRAARLDAPGVAARVLAGLYRRVPFLRHAPRRAPDLPDSLAAPPLAHPRLERLRAREGPLELGTLGRGNHFLELQADETDDALWLMVHSGSRAMGQAIRDHHLAAAGPARDGLRSFAAASGAGQAYLADHAWAVAYAIENRRLLVEAAAAVVGEELGGALEPDGRIECVHNHVRAEDVDGQRLWVHRKGAIPARDGEAGIIPGSMGTASFHVEGRGVAAALFSSSHGAGRAMSRGEALRRIPLRELEGQVSGVWYDRRMAPRLRDEAPGAYKDVRAVLRAERDLTRIVRTLRPVLSFKGA